jgi:hypothetical protein
MCLLEVLQNQRVSILIDPGSTHNFLDPTILAKVNLSVTFTLLLQVKIANGDTTQCFGRVTTLSLKVQGHPILAEFYLISLRGCDMVLRVQWLQNLGPVLWIFSLLTMLYTYRGVTALLEGLGSMELFMEEGGQFLKPDTSANKGFLLKLISGNADQLVSSYPPAIQSLLHTYKSAFAEPLTSHPLVPMTVKSP